VTDYANWSCRFCGSAYATIPKLLERDRTLHERSCHARPVEDPDAAKAARLDREFRDRAWARDLLAQPTTRVTKPMRWVGVAFMLHVDFQTLESWAGGELLQRETGYSLTVVRQSLAALRRQGWLYRVSKGNNLKGECDVHRLAWPKWHVR
jgi:hypothetical protein